MYNNRTAPVLAVHWFALQIRVRDVMVSAVTPHECRVRTFIKAITASFHILANSAFPVIDSS